MKENRKSDFCLVWMSKNLMWCVKCLQTSRQQNHTERSNDQNLRSDIKLLIGKLKSLIQIQIHPVLPLHCLIKLWRMRTIRTCHVCHFLSPSFNSAATSVATPGPNFLTKSHLGWIMKFSFKHISNTFWKSHFGLGWMPREEEKATRWMCLRSVSWVVGIKSST